MSKYPSTQAIFFWNILGSLSTGLIAFLLLFGVSRFLPVKDGDFYSYAYALGHLFSIVALFQVRNYQSTDIEQQYSFNDYLGARFWTCLLMLGITGGYLFINKFRPDENLVIFLVCLYRLTDAVSDVFQGLFQQQERMDWAGKSLFFRNALMVVTFIIFLALTRNLVTALLMLNVSSLLVILGFDWRKARSLYIWHWEDLFSKRILSLLKQCAPLFLIGFLLVNIYNQPKYVLNKFYQVGQIAEGIQKDFNILFMPVFVMSLLILVLRPLMTQIAIYVMEKELKKFLALQNRLVVIQITLSVIVLIGGWTVALPLLEIIYHTPLVQYQSVFLILLCGGIVSSFSTLLDNFLTVFRRQYLLLVAYALAFLVSIVFTDSLVAGYGLLGAALSFLLVMVTCLIVLLVTYLIIFRRVKREFF